jgi:hypothetical protein
LGWIRLICACRAWVTNTQPARMASIVSGE